MQRHGGLRIDELRAFGLDPAEVIAVSASVNPYGPSPRVRDARSRLDLSRYPDPDSLALTEEIGEAVSQGTLRRITSPSNFEGRP